MKCIGCRKEFIGTRSWCNKGCWNKWRICEVFKYGLGIIKHEDMITNNRNYNEARS